MSSFWNSYYTSGQGDNALVETPSSFALCVESWGVQANGNVVVDLGCGNGRDSNYFASRGAKKVIGFDADPAAIARTTKNGTVEGMVGDIGALPSLETPIDIVYSRFSMHSVKPEVQNNAIKWAFKSLNAGGVMCIETRSTNDPRCGDGTPGEDPDSWVGTHYRRFQTLPTLMKELESIGFKVEQAVEDWKSANFGTDLAVVARVLARVPEAPVMEASSE